MSLRRLKVDTIDLYQLHRIDPKVPADESLGALKEMQQAGKIRHIGLCEVSVDEIKHAQTIVESSRCRTFTTSPTASPRKS